MRKLALLFALFLVLPLSSIIAQEEEEEITSDSKISLDVTVKNRHLWRCGVGIDGFSVQSTLQYSYKFLRIGAWGAYELAPGSYEELDLYIELDFAKYFTFGFYDFYYPSGKTGRTKRDFSDFSDSPSRVFDTFLSFSGPESFPIGFIAAVYPFGKDDQKADGDQQYSNYFEANYTVDLKNSQSLKFYVGATAGENSSFAARGYKDDSGKLVDPDNQSFNLIGLGTKYSRGFTIGKFDAGVSGEFLYNPNVDGVYLALVGNITF